MDLDMAFLPDAEVSIELTQIQTIEQARNEVISTAAPVTQNNNTNPAATTNSTNPSTGFEGTEIHDITPCFGSSLDELLGIDVQALDMVDLTAFPPALFDGFSGQDLELGMHPGIWE